MRVHDGPGGPGGEGWGGLVAWVTTGVLDVRVLKVMEANVIGARLPMNG